MIILLKTDSQQQQQQQEDPQAKYNKKMKLKNGFGSPSFSF